MPATTFLPMTSNTLEVDPGWFSPGLMMATRDLQVFNMNGEQKLTGSIGGPLFPSNAMELMCAAIGTDAVSGSAPPYTHTISQANRLASLTIEKNLGNYQSVQYAGCRVGKLSVKCAAGNSPVELSADVSGQSATVLTTPTAVSVTNEIPYLFAEGTLTLMSHARAEVTNVEVSIDNGLKETWTYGNRGPGFITPVTLHVSGTIDLVWSSLNDGTYGDFTSMVNGTLGTLDLKFAHPDGINSVELVCPQIALSKYSNDIKLTDVIMSTLTFEASKNLTSGYSIQAVVKNSVSTAY